MPAFWQSFCLFFFNKLKPSCGSTCDASAWPSMPAHGQLGGTSPHPKLRHFPAACHKRAQLPNCTLPSFQHYVTCRSPPCPLLARCLHQHLPWAARCCQGARPLFARFHLSSPAMDVSIHAATAGRRGRAHDELQPRPRTPMCTKTSRRGGQECGTEAQGARSRARVWHRARGTAASNGLTGRRCCGVLGCCKRAQVGPQLSRFDCSGPLRGWSAGMPRRGAVLESRPARSGWEAR